MIKKKRKKILENKVINYRKNNSRNINNPGKNINGRLKARQLILEGWKVAAVMLECGVSCKTAYGFKNELKELM